MSHQITNNKTNKSKKLSIGTNLPLLYDPWNLSTDSCAQQLKDNTPLVWPLSDATIWKEGLSKIPFHTIITLSCGNNIHSF